MHVNATRILAATGLFGTAVPTAATINIAAVMKVAPYKRMVLLPK
jgi:hypothetical protein